MLISIPIHIVLIAVGIKWKNNALLLQYSATSHVSVCPHLGVILDLSLGIGLEEMDSNGCGSREKLAVSWKSTTSRDSIIVSSGETGLLSSHGDCFHRVGNYWFIRQSYFVFSNGYGSGDYSEQAMTDLFGKEDSAEIRGSVVTIIIMINTYILLTSQGLLSLPNISLTLAADTLWSAMLGIQFVL